MSEKPTTFDSEDAWTSRLAAMLKRRDDVITGIGDDCAVVRVADRDLVYTTDAVVESVHFYPGTEPERIGHKMAGRLLSDIAAMGAEPDHLLFNIVVPPAYPASDMEAIYRGAKKLAASFGVSIVGGDTMKGEPLALHGFGTGHVPRGSAVLRGGARAGDIIYVTGKLGGSLAGKHLDFTPRIREGRWLREGGWANAMMDISDGLARDLPRICQQSGVGAELRASEIPANLDLQHALADGEDYELLFTIASEKRMAFEKAWSSFSDLSCAAIGTIQGPPEVIQIIDPAGTRHPLSPGGYDHLGG
jgi:thiamine-monophosphate kinase